MKKLLFAAAALLSCSLAFAQGVPQRINYQAVALDADGDPIPGYDMVGRPIDNAEMDIRLTIHDGSPSGAQKFRESHTVRTDAYGLFTLEIGAGTLIAGDFATIDWADSDRYLRIEMDRLRNGNWTLLGVQQMLTVPYAFVAERALNADFADQAQQAVQSTYSRFSDTALFAANSAIAQNALHADSALWAVNVINNDDADADSTNELQVLTRSNDTLFLSQGGFVVLPTDLVDDADNNPTNELQNLSIAGDSLLITNGTGVVLPTDSNTTYSLVGYTTGGATGFRISLLGSDSSNNSINVSPGAGIQFGGTRNNYVIGTSAATPSQAGANYGDMLFWNGTQWSTVPVGNPGDVLTLSNNQKPTWKPRHYSLGDTALGGIVAYIFGPNDVGYIPGEQHGIIAALNDLPAKHIWGSGFLNTAHVQFLFSNLSPLIGMGKQNTDTIISKLVNSTLSFPAASATTTYSAYGFNDWFLPSSGDLVAIKNALPTSGISNFTTVPVMNNLSTGYWSSSIMTTFVGALAPMFAPGAGVCGCAFFEQYFVRPVRYF
jgi:hypothetical protein